MVSFLCYKQYGAQTTTELGPTITGCKHSGFLHSLKHLNDFLLITGSLSSANHWLVLHTHMRGLISVFSWVAADYQHSIPPPLVRLQQKGSVHPSKSYSTPCKKYQTASQELPIFFLKATTPSYPETSLSNSSPYHHLWVMSCQRYPLHFKNVLKIPPLQPG